MLFMSLISYAQIKVAVIDTGLDYRIANDIPLCQSGHTWDLKDSWEPKHGTHVSGLINQYTGKTRYCQIILQVFDKSNKKQSVKNIQNALKKAIKLKVDVINLSLGGGESIPEEKQLILTALNNKIKVVVASGNERMIINKKNCKWFPACYDKRIIVVSGTNDTANKGDIVDFTEESIDLTVYGITMTGTSQAAAIRTGKIIKELGKTNVSK
jgi:Subtilase family